MTATPPTPSRPSPPGRRLLRRGSWREASFVAQLLRTETVGGAILLVAALLAIAWANSPWRDAYGTLRDTKVGPASMHLDLSLGTWAADGLLALFFLVAGIELKREFVAASGTELGGILRGWAIPTATDIAFALAVLAVIGTHLPSALRSFLLTLAVVDDLIAIAIIAVFYTESVNFLMLAAAVVPLAIWWLLLRKGITNPLIVAVPAILAWLFVHESGIHATVAGVLLGLLVPVNREIDRDPTRHSLAERMEHRLRPFSAGFAVPVFAFFAAGVTVVGGGFTKALSDPAAVGVVAGLVVGKALGVFTGTWAIARFTHAELDEDIAWTDVFGLALLSGVGFTVSLLIGELAFGPGSARDDHVRLAVLVGSLVAAVFAAVVLRLRNRHYRLVEEHERADGDADGIPDAYEPAGP
jgi:NhaA family Na+:H+ antiporter